MIESYDRNILPSLSVTAPEAQKMASQMDRIMFSIVKELHTTVIFEWSWKQFSQVPHMLQFITHLNNQEKI
jgi:hypothetical protein